VSSAPGLLPQRLPETGELVQVRSRRWLVEEVVPATKPGQSAVVRLACADDDAQGFDKPRMSAAFLHTLRWGCVTTTDPGLFQSPFWAGIKIDTY
jgi:hypothetical protein